MYEFILINFNRIFAPCAGSDDLVSKFYDNAVIFITGGTGFLGKVLVEKLLRSFSIERIYLLVRVKHNLAVNERLKRFFEESVMIYSIFYRHFWLL